MGRRRDDSISSSDLHQRRGYTTMKKQSFQKWKRTILVICIIVYLTYIASYYQSHHITISTDYDYHNSQPILGDESSTQQPNNILTIVGMSYRDNTTSDMAINFLVDAACNYGIPSYLLLSDRDSELSLDKKITALAHHYGQSLDNVVDYPDCMKLIDISLSPSDEDIYKMTHQSYINHNSSLETNQQLINNPLDKNNRIARIKRSREYQRQQMYNILKSSHTNNKDAEWKRNSAIVVLDLDLLAYPSPSDLIETTRKFIVTPSSTVSYQAICANGLMTVYSKSKQESPR